MTEMLEVRGIRGSGEYVRRQRLYRAEELGSLFERVGLSIVGVFASADGAPFQSSASPTTWIVGHRAG